MLVQENLKNNSPYVWKRGVYVFFYSMGFFFLNSKRESKYPLFDILYNIALAYFYWEFIQFFYNLKEIIIFFDFFVKLLFYKGLVTNLKNLLYLPISVIQKKMILFCLPLVSLTSLPMFSAAFNHEYVVLLFMIINSFFIFNIKTNRKEIIHFLFFYVFSSIIFFSFLGEGSLVMVTVIMFVFLLSTYKIMNSYLKLN